jgi:DNA (cytosine-5)-methyltransferase 1
MGYHRAGFQVVGVDHTHQPRYPFEFHKANAFDFLDRHAHHYDIIHASPPCQAYTGMRNITLARFNKLPSHPDLIARTRQALLNTGKPYIIENVQNSPLYTTIILCGAALGLPHVARHRHFESSVLLFAPPCAHYQEPYTVGVYGERPDGRRLNKHHHRPNRAANSLQEAQQLLQIDWMQWRELCQAVPPAYTHYIGKQLLAHLNRRSAP